MSVRQSLRAFWSDPGQRRVLMAVLGVVALLVAVYGAFVTVRAHFDYGDRQDDVRAAEQKLAALETALGLTQVGEDEPAPEIGQYDAMLLMAFQREIRDAHNAGVDASNRRLAGIRIIGIGFVIFALAYAVAPTSADRRAPHEPPSEHQAR